MKLPAIKSAHQVSSNPRIEMQRSAFDRTHAHKTTFDAGKLIPVFLDEVLPGDTFSVDATIFARLATPIYPIMDNMTMDIHFFFCPNRILWTNWVKLQGEQTNPGDSISYMTPIVTVNAGSGVGFAAGSLYDYFGLPTEIDDISVSNLPGRMYNRVYQDWYRDQNIINSPTIDTGDGPDTLSNYTIRSRAKMQDYFTTALSTPQKGSAVSIPLTGNATVVRNPSSGPFSSASIIRETDTGNINAVGYRLGKKATTGVLQDDLAGVQQFTLDPNGTMVANLSTATTTTINELREAFAVQQLLERDARGGTRYPEILMSQFGVQDPSMGILQRPEFLGGSSAPLIVTPIAQTSGSATPNFLGELAGMGTITGRAGFTKSFTEHGWIMGIVSTRSTLSYWQGIDRMFSRRDRYDFYMPVLSNIGEQGILKQEIYATENATTNAEIFGYQERWSEYRHAKSKISGLFKPNHAQTLAAWHLAQDFGSMPTLNETFITETPPMARVIAVTTEPHFIFDSYFKVRAVRCMPLYSVPGLSRL